MNHLSSSFTVHVYNPKGNLNRNTCLKGNYSFLFGETLPKGNPALSFSFGLPAPNLHPAPGPPTWCHAMWVTGMNLMWLGESTVSRMILGAEPPCNSQCPRPLAPPLFFSLDQRWIHKCRLLSCSDWEVSSYLLYIFMMDGGGEGVGGIYLLCLDIWIINVVKPRPLVSQLGELLTHWLVPDFVCIWWLPGQSLPHGLVCRPDGGSHRVEAQY